jgi:hypothetical protein
VFLPGKQAKEACKQAGHARSNGRSESPESHRRESVLDAGDDLDLFVDEMADVIVVSDIELGHQVEIAGSRINLRRDLGVGKSAGNLVGFAEVAFDLHEKRLHRLASCLAAAFQDCLVANCRRRFKRAGGKVFCTGVKPESLP